MSHLIDTDVLIQAKNGHYRFDVCPGYWEWLELSNSAGKVFSIQRVLEELTAGDDALAEWAKSVDNGFFLEPDDPVAVSLGTVSQWVEAEKRFTDGARADFYAAADYYLVAHALAHDQTVVTHERANPDSKARILIPDVCAGCGVDYLHPFDLLETEGVRLVLPPGFAITVD